MSNKVDTSFIEEETSRDTYRKFKIKWIEDESNNNQKFERGEQKSFKTKNFES